MELFDVTQKSLEVALHGTELRQQVISNNLANVNTPGFKRSDVEFGPALAEALQFTTPPPPSARVTPVVKTDNAVRDAGRRQQRRRRPRGDVPGADAAAVLGR